MPGVSSFSNAELAERMAAALRADAEHIQWLREQIRLAVDFICESGTAAEMDREMLVLRDMLSDTLVASLKRSER